ncbi:MAG: hypothetical protein ABMB14_36305 [Myxococcota bacterium]
MDHVALVVGMVGCAPAPVAPDAGDPCVGPGTICTIAGDDEIGLGADGIAATASPLYFPQDVAVVDDREWLLVDWNNHRIRRIRDGIATTIVGRFGVPGDGPEGPAADADVNHPTGVALAPDGGLWVAGFHTARVYRIDPATDALSFEAGAGLRGDWGDGGPADDAAINQPSSLVVLDDGSVVFSDQGNQLLRRIAPDGTIDRFAGTVGDPGCSGDGGPASEAAFGSLAAGYLAPNTRLVRAGGDLLLVDTEHQRIRAIDLDTGVIRTAVGPRGCGGPADLVVSLTSPADVAIGPDGGWYVVDRDQHCVVRIDPDTSETSVAVGICGVPGFSGDGGPAVDATLDGPTGIDIGGDGAIYVADGNNHRVRRVTAPEIAR